MRKAKTQEPEGFADYWAIWQPISRHTDGRGLARDTFRRHVEAGVSPQDIIDGAQWFVRTLTERDKPYVPLSSTWLNRAAYEDGAIKEREFQARQAERQQQDEKVVSMRRVLPENHFSRKWESMQGGK